MVIVLAMTHTTLDEANPETLVPGLEFRFRIDAQTTASIPIDDRSTGELGFIPITGGNFSGNLSGTVTPGGDWCLRKAPGTYRVEARYGLLTDAGAYVDVHNVGILTESSAAGNASAPAEYFMSTPVFRTADPDLDWLNSAVFIGHAKVLDGFTRIDVFEVCLPQRSPASGADLP